MGIERVKRAADPTLSVVVPSVPEYDHRPTIACLEDQSFRRPYEVIVVNDGSVDRSTARNRGMEVASADVVALTDDDTRPPTDWLSSIWSEFRADPSIVCLEGPVYGGARSTRPRRYVGCNLAVDRETALAVGGFRSDFCDWREDVEFGWRMEAVADGTCKFSETVRMCHPKVPRTAFDRELERRLKAEYPNRYAEVMNAELTRRVYRAARAAGLTQPIQRLINVVRAKLLSSKGEHPFAPSITPGDRRKAR